MTKFCAGWREVKPATFRKVGNRVHLEAVAMRGNDSGAVVLKIPKRWRVHGTRLCGTTISPEGIVYELFISDDHLQLVRGYSYASGDEGEVVHIFASWQIN